MTETSEIEKSGRWWTTGTALLVLLAAVKVLLHVGTNLWGGYGYFRDELYYIACSEHLDFGYVDQPPLSIVVLAISRALFGDSLVALRLLPAIAGGATLYGTGVLARDLGGGRFAQVMAGIGILVSPVFLAGGGFYSMNAFEGLIWVLSFLLIVRIRREGGDKQWAWLGVVLGLGLLNKISVFWLAAGIAVMVLVTKDRHFLKTRGPWIAAAVALVLFLPYILWNATHDFAHLEFMRNASGEKYASQTPVTFLVGQVLTQNPLSLPLWLAGLWFFFFSGAGRTHRPLGFLYAVPLFILLINWHSKPEYLGAAYPLLFAAGSVMWEQWLVHPRLVRLRSVAAGILVMGLLGAPLVLPVIPVEQYIRYAEALGVAPSTPEGKQLGELPQFYADMFGWEELASTVAGVYHTLPPDEQEETVIFTTNYGRAGAIDFFGRRYGLPRAYSGHNNYFLWPPPPRARVIIIIGGRLDDHRESLSVVERVAVKTCRYCMPYENNVPVFVGRGLKRSLSEIWPSTKHYD